MYRSRWPQNINGSHERSAASTQENGTDLEA